MANHHHVQDLSASSNPRQINVLNESPIYIAFVAVLIAVCFCSFCADFLIVSTVFKRNGLRTIPYIILAHWAIADMCYLLASPIKYSLYGFHPIMEHSSEAYIIDIIAEIEAITNGTAVFFILLLAIDWFMERYFREASDKFRKFYKYVVGLIWAYTLILCCLSIRYNVNDESFFAVPSGVFYIAYTVLALLVIIMHVYKCVKAENAENSALPLTLATVFVGLWVYRSLGHAVFELGDESTLFLEIISYLTALIMFVILYFKDKDFQSSVGCKT